MPLYWNPDPVAFNIPFLNIPIFIYGLCFVIGFAFGYFQLVRLLKKTLPEKDPKEISTLVDQLTWFVIGGTIIGARLGHVFFYDWDRYKDNLWQILNTREGGLASHGGTLGVMLALAIFYFFIFKKKTGLSFLQLLDHMVLPASLVAFFIRLGNFFNQEILGTPSNLPWAVQFGSPADGSIPVPRHPAQLYEGLAYLITFVILTLLWHKTDLKKKSGFITGLFFVLAFGSRFIIEFVKEHQHSVLDQSFLQAGQTLSHPFIFLGLFLMIRALKLYEVKHT